MAADVFGLNSTDFAGYNRTPTSADNVGANETSFQLHEYLELQLGKRNEHMTTVVLLTITYTLIFVTGVTGNVCTCVVIIKNKYMHTATNCYLFSLAISDFATLILALPSDMYTLWEAYPWRFGSVFCYLKSYITEMTSYASVLTIVAFTIERYFAICHPMFAHKVSVLSRVYVIILAIWIIACACALPYPIHSRLFHYVDYPVNTSLEGQPIPESLICSIPRGSKKVMKTVFQVSTFVFFVAPMTIIIVIYILIGVALWRPSFEGNKSTTFNGSLPNQSTSRTRRAVLRMLVAVVIAFFVCWAPFHAQRLMTIYIQEKDWTPVLLQIQTHIYYLSGVLYAFNSTVNPILYNLMSRRYRKAFKLTLCRCLLDQSTWQSDHFRFSTIRSTASTYSNLRHPSRDPSRHNAPPVSRDATL